MLVIRWRVGVRDHTLVEGKLHIKIVNVVLMVDVVLNKVKSEAVRLISRPFYQLKKIINGFKLVNLPVFVKIVGLENIFFEKDTRVATDIRVFRDNCDSSEVIFLRTNACEFTTLYS